MAWPQSQDYNEAIQNPESSFFDADLRGGKPVTNAMGMPMPRSGNFADVYEFDGAGGAKWAVKCFTRHVPGLQERYSEISSHLLRFRSDAGTVEQKVAWIDRWIERANQKEASMGGRLDEERRRRREELSREQAELADLNTRWAKL